MVNEDEERIEERVAKILAEERRIKRLNKIVPMVLIYVMGILIVIALAGILYKTIKIPGEVRGDRGGEKSKLAKSRGADREKFDLYFNSKFLKIVGKIDFIDSWFLNNKRNKLTIMVKKNWYDMNDYNKISALKILREEFAKIYSNSSLSKNSSKSPVVNLINSKGDIIAICDKNGALLK